MKPGNLNNAFLQHQIEIIDIKFKNIKKIVDPRTKNK